MHRKAPRRRRRGTRKPTPQSGLDGVPVADTALSRVDGEGGALVVRGRYIRDLAGHVPFAALCSLLWTGDLKRGDEFGSRLGSARSEAFERLPDLARALQGADFMAALAASLAQVGPGPHDSIERALAVTGAVAVVVPALYRARLGEVLVAPDPARTHAADFLAMLSGEEPSPARATALDTYLVTVAEHGMNASTFTARIVASTGSDLASCVVAAICALKGPLHGGAPGPVLDMFDAVGSADRAPEWVQAELAAGRRIMGMGHRVYRARDPRVAVLEQAARGLAAGPAVEARLALSAAIEEVATRLLTERHPERPIHANVEFATAVLLEALGIPRELFSSVFATARVAGWCGHVMEQRAGGRILRPGSRYVGPEPG